MFKSMYEKVADIIYMYGCVNFTIFCIATIILVFLGLIQIADIGFIFLLIALGTVIIGCGTSVIFFAISKIIKNGDKQFEQNKEIIKLLSK